MNLPLLICPRHPLGDVLADPGIAPWTDIAPIALRETETREPPVQPTWFKAAWNEEELRVLFSLEDDYIWHTLTERDSRIYNEEVVEIFLNPDGRLETYYELELNPVNTVCDIVLWKEKEAYRHDFKWDCQGLRTATRRTEKGWCGEFSIPFASINGKPEGQWRANFYRIDRPKRKPRELSAWSPTLRRKFHTQARFGILEFGKQ